MVATESTDGNLAFKNVVGYIKVTPTSDCKKITLTSNSTSVNLAGTVDISIADDGTPTANIASGASDASNSVSIEGTIKANTTYYIAALPATLEGGFKLVFTDGEGNEKYGESDKTLTIKHNTITDLGNGIPYVTFSAASEQGFIMTLGVNNKFQYSVGNGEWTAIASGEEVKFGGTNNDLRLRGTSAIGTAADSYNYSTIHFTDSSVKVQCSGDIRTLIDWEDYKNADITKGARFAYLFYKCSVLTSAPELPATTLAGYCYDGMFYNCSSLKTAPVLPAEALADHCYYNMFEGCKSLTSAPDLPAKTLASYCYEYMFSGCTSLDTAPNLPATTLASKCYMAMFSGCDALKSDIELPAETLADYCYSEMFKGCSYLTKIILRATSREDASDPLTDWLSGTSSYYDRTIYTDLNLSDEESAGWDVKALSALTD